MGFQLCNCLALHTKLFDPPPPIWRGEIFRGLPREVGNSTAVTLNDVSKNVSITQDGHSGRRCSVSHRARARSFVRTEGCESKSVAG